MSEWQIKPLARSSAVSGSPFAPGDRVVCVLHVDVSGLLVRTDLHQHEAESFHSPGEVLGRWTRIVPDASADAEKEARRAALQSSEELFLSLYQPHEHTETTAGQPGAEESPERRTLKQVLALMLERKRLLKPLSRPHNGVQAFRHVPTGAAYEVPAHKLEPERLLSIQEQLSALV